MGIGLLLFWLDTAVVRQATYRREHCCCCCVGVFLEQNWPLRLPSLTGTTERSWDHILLYYCYMYVCSMHSRGVCIRVLIFVLSLTTHIHACVTAVPATHCVAKPPRGRCAPTSFIVSRFFFCATDCCLCNEVGH